MLMFGLLKFISPFKDWYTTQVSSSGMGNAAYGSGIIGEVVTGLALLFILLIIKSGSLFLYTFYAAMLSIITMMVTAIYVHLHPDVPADVLPLKIKPPIIPPIFILMAILNIFLLPKNLKTTKPP